MALQANDLEVQFRGRPLDDALREALKIYVEHGCFLAKGLLSEDDLNPTCDDISKLIQAQIRRHKIELPKGKNGSARFDDGVIELAKKDRSSIGHIFDACRRLLPVHQVSVDPRLIGTAQTLMGADVLAASDIKAVRIDLPAESKYLFDWHQDFPYVMDSLDAVVFWIPLHDVAKANGCLSVATGTQKLGLQKLVVDDPDNADNNKQKVMHIANLEFLDHFPKLQVETKYGDALVFSTLLLHASNPNLSQSARFTLQVRFGNFLHPFAIEKGWPGSMRDGSVFHKLHPEFVAANVPPGKQEMVS